MLGSWPSPDRVEDSVPDPIGAPYAYFREVCSLIDGHVERIARSLAAG